MLPRKSNIRYTIAAAFIILAMGFFLAIASVFWFTFYTVLLLLLKIKRAGRNKISAHQIN